MIAPLILLAAAPFRTIDIEYDSPTAKSVLFAGDITGWDAPKPLTRQGDKWTISFRMPADARFEYKLVVDGKWILDPNDPAKCSNGLGGENSVWIGPAYRFNPDDAPPKTPMHRMAFGMAGKQIVVYAPDNSNGLPILAYADGEEYETIGKIQDVVENLVEEGRIRPVVIVLVPHGKDRIKEYGTDWQAYGKFLLDQVLPEVRKRTGASPSATDVFLGGSSLGGTIAVRLAEEFSDKVAGGIHSQSGAFQWHPLNLNYPDLYSTSSVQKIAPSTRIWLDWGRFEDGLSTANQAMVQSLRAEGRVFEYKITDEGHNWTAWRHRMTKGLLYLLAPRA